MGLKTRRWGSPRPEAVVCLHGLSLHGGIFEGLATRLVERGHSVVALDLRGHGGSPRRPPWDVATHVADVLESVAELDIERVTWVGHSFGGLLAATIAAQRPELSERLVLLDPALQVPADRALRGAEMDRLDWSFATVDGALNALMSGETIVSAPREVVAAFVREDVKKGPDGRYRYSFCPATAVAAWSEMARPAPPVAQLPTLAVRATVPLVDPRPQIERYRSELDPSLLTEIVVPNGHNLLWESPEETISAVEAFLS